MLHRLLTAISCVALSAAAAGCVVYTDPQPPRPTWEGSLTTYWTLAGSSDPALCLYFGVDRVDVAVYDSADRSVTWAQPHCEDFGVSFDGLDDQSYTVEATLLDVNGVPVSDTVIAYTDVW